MATSATTSQYDCWTPRRALIHCMEYWIGIDFCYEEEEAEEKEQEEQEEEQEQEQEQQEQELSEAGRSLCI